MPRRSGAATQTKPPAPALVIARGVLFAYFFSLCIFLIFSTLIQFTGLTEAVLPYVAYGTSLVTIFAGAAYVSNRLDTKGWLNGGITGLIYLAGLLIFALILLPDFSIHMGYVSKALLAFVTGAAGGIFGVNS